MPITISSLANMEVSGSMLTGQAQASSMGLDSSAGNTLAMGNLMGKSSGGGLVNTLLGGLNSKGGMSGTGLQSGLQSIAGAAVSGMMQKAGLSSGGMSIMDSGDGGSIISLKV